MIALYHCPTDSVCSLTGFVLGRVDLQEMCEFSRGPRTILNDQECNWAPAPGQVPQSVMFPTEKSLRRGCGGAVQQAELGNLPQHWKIAETL